MDKCFFLKKIREKIIFVGVHLSTVSSRLWVFVCSSLCSPFTSCVGPCMYSCVLGSFPTLCISMKGVVSAGLVVPSAPVFCSLWELAFDIWVDMYLIGYSSFTLVLVTVCIVPGLADINTVCVECLCNQVLLITVVLFLLCFPVPDWVFVCSSLCSPLTSCVGPCMYSCVLGSFPTLCICMEGVVSVGLVVPAAPVFCSLLENWHLTYELIFILLVIPPSHLFWSQFVLCLD